jgi:hypothetical protein
LSPRKEEEAGGKDKNTKIKKNKKDERGGEDNK